MEAIAIRMEAIAIRMEAIASRMEAIASRMEAIAIRMGAIAIRMDIRMEAIAKFVWGPGAAAVEDRVAALEVRACDALVLKRIGVRSEHHQTLRHKWLGTAQPQNSFKPVWTGVPSKTMYCKKNHVQDFGMNLLLILPL